MKGQEQMPGSDVGKQTRIAVLLTTFNRRPLTLQCLEALFAQEVAGVTLQVFLVDDASSDGTAEAVAERFPGVHIEHGSGELYWVRGMHRAFASALAIGFDYYLWFNDDTLLHADALARLLATAAEKERGGAPPIVTGSTSDPLTGVFTYGGFCWRSKWIPPLLRHVHPDPDAAVECVTMNGNFTLIPQAVAQIIGNLDPHFQHSLGDIDYGLRATAAGFHVYAVPGYIGTCSDNSVSGTWRDADLSLRQRWKQMQSPKGSPWKEWSYFARRHMGPLWPLYAVSPYVKLILSAVLFKR